MRKVEIAVIRKFTGCYKKKRRNPTPKTKRKVKLTKTQLSPRIVPGLESLGLVSPSMTLPVLTTLNPSQTMASTGPEAMYLIKPGKKGRPARSA